jgi:hypothetical protein
MASDTEKMGRFCQGCRRLLKKEAIFEKIEALFEKIEALFEKKAAPFEKQRGGQCAILWQKS